MAIIYTYPRLTNPDGTELIVVSETKNQNATRLLSVGDICEFCDESTGCDHSFKYIQTSSLTPAEAVGCDQTLELISSDATVTITNVGNTIDFKTAGGGGGCPTNYVIKPVECDDFGECRISTKLAEWVWTCDETLGALAPGYIDSLTLNGTSIPHPAGGTECWYIEAVTLSASATTCETCCPPPGTPTFSFVDCTDSLSYVTVDVDPGLVIGKVFTYCCEPATEFQTVKCWEYVGDVGQPVGGTFDPCINFGAELDNCDCCFNRCNYTYTACVGAPVGFPGTLTFNLGMDPTSTCECTSPQNDIVVDDGAGNFWCYNTPESICLPADEGYTILGVPDNPCDDAVYCPPVAATYTWQECGGGPYITVAVDPGIPVGQIDRYCCGAEEKTHHCYEYLGNIGQPVAGAFPCAGPIETYPADCICCDFPCTYQYVACPGRPAAFAPTIDVQVPFDISGCDCDTPDPDIYITIGEETWCYNTPTKVCLPPTTTPTGLAVCGDGEICPTPDLRWKMCSEGELDWRYEDPVDPIPAPFNVPGNHYIGELNTPGTCVNGDCCIEVEATVETGTLVGWSTFLGETSCDSAYNATWEDCACCVNHDVVEYTACDETCAVGEPAIHYPTIYVDVCLWGDHIGESWKPSNAPTFITLSPGGEECCYQLTDQDPCIPETLISTHGFTYDDLGYGDPAWIDCTCTDIVYFQYKECGSAEWIDTDTDLELYDNGSAWGDGTICYEIQQGGFGGPAIDPLVLFPTQYEEGAGGVTACQCCEQDLRLYVICDGAAGVTCNAAAPATLLIDVSSIPGYNSVTYATVIGEEIASSIQCCYTYSDVAECQPPTGTIISTATGCEDVACNLL